MAGTTQKCVNVRFGSKADIQRYPLQCPLLGAKRTLNRPATRISLRNYESTAQRVKFLWKFVEGKAESRVSPGLFSLKSRSTRGCNRSRDAPEDAEPAICESRVARVRYMGRKKTHFDFFPSLASKPAFFSHAARRSSTITVVPSLCLFQSLDRIIFGMIHISPMCRAHTRTHSFQTLSV